MPPKDKDQIVNVNDLDKKDTVTTETENEVVEPDKKYEITLSQARSYITPTIDRTFYRDIPVITSDKRIIEICQSDANFKVREILE